MSFEVSVGPPVLTINQGNTFMVTDLDGSIRAESAMGLFSFDTRFVSYYEVSANGKPWTILSSGPLSYHSARFHLLNQSFDTETGKVLENTIALTMDRSIGEGVTEKLLLVNYNIAPVKFNLEIAFRCDFADIFEVRGNSFYRRGRIVSDWNVEKQYFSNVYSNRDFQRHLIYRITKSDSKAHSANGRVTFEIELLPAATWECQCQFELKCQESTDCVPGRKRYQADELQKDWNSNATRTTTSNEEIYRFYQRSVDDMGAMRLFEQLRDTDLWIPAAGVPWYVTLFGRDSLIVSLQTMFVNARLGIGALHELATYQADKMDDWRDAQPGKIPHEIRFGELAHFKRIPHTPYYGSADATPLFLIVLHESWKWLGDISLLKQYREIALKCLDWIEKYGDIDGDGFQEYKTYSPVGYENMGWKDAGDAIVYPDGSQVKQPKALCELQGYVYDAWLRMAEVFCALDENDKANELKSKAAKLKMAFNDKFWCDDLGFYAQALDAKKQPVKSITSNVGHCLWSGIISEDRAQQVVQRFFQPDLWSGWGIRTLSSENPAFNPHSYHLGSIWPHDNGLIALGFKKYGFDEEAARVARDISEAASFFVGHRIPELYAGTERTASGFPVQYTQANVPQAWASGSIFHLLQALLGLQADAPNRRLYVSPHLPKWLPDIALTGMIVGEASVNLRFWRDNSGCHWHADLINGSLEVIEKEKQAKTA